MTDNPMTEIEKDKDTKQTQGNKYEQNGSAGIGHFSNGEIQDGATVAGMINEIREIRIDTVNYVQQPSNSPKKEVGNKTSKRLAFAIAGSLDEADRAKLRAIVALLRKLTGDASIEMVDLEEGSIRIILEGSEEGLKKIERLFQSGKLSEVEGIPVEYVQFQDEESERKKWERDLGKMLEEENEKIKEFIVSRVGEDVLEDVLKEVERLKEFLNPKKIDEILDEILSEEDERTKVLRTKKILDETIFNRRNSSIRKEIIPLIDESPEYE